jgi:tetratricopeptide (TPR) repeat protein
VSRRVVASLASLPVLAAITVAAALAHAGPSVWERAKRTAKGEDVARLDVAYRKALDLDARALIESSVGRDDLAEDDRLNGISLLLSAGVARSDDARALRLLGGMYASVRRCEQAVPVLRRAIALAPSSSLSAAAWFEIAICASHGGDRGTEASAYEHALAIADDPHERAALESNLAEAKMGLGDLKGAIEAAERSIAIRDDNPAAFWNLAILKDRTADEAGALQAATEATSLDPAYGFLDGPDVFFTPPYDRHWYHALGELAWAERDVADAVSRRVHLYAAKDEYDAWLAAADADDRYRSIAIARAQRIEKAIAALPKEKTGVRAAPQPAKPKK